MLKPDGLTTSGLYDELERRGVRYLIPSYVDMHGVSKSKMVPLAHMDQMMNGSELCTGAALDGVPQEIHEEEVSAHPDAASCMILPWQNDVAWFASDLWCENKPFEPCSRNIMKRTLDRLADTGLSAKVGMEAEFFVLKDTGDGGYGPVSDRQHLEKPAYDVKRLVDNLHWIGELVDAMNELGWDVYSFDHEDGIGQFELDFAFAPALQMADRYVFFRWMAGEIARAARLLRNVHAEAIHRARRLRGSLQYFTVGQGRRNQFVRRRRRPARWQFVEAGLPLHGRTAQTFARAQRDDRAHRE